MRRLRRLEAWLAERPLRERLLVAATATVMLWAVVNLTVLDPLGRSLERHEGAREEAVRRAGTLHELRDALRTRLDHSPDDEARREVARLTRKLDALNARLEEAQAGLLAPPEMNAALQAVLSARPALRVLSLETEGSEPLLPETPQRDGVTLYLHRGVFELEGDWSSVLAALRELESLSWHIRWDTLRYRVTNHPRAHVTLRFHTLGTRPEWVGG